MIILDEQLLDPRLIEVIDSSFRGRVVGLSELRSGVIADRDIPDILAEHRPSTFLTLNPGDFWARVAPHPAYSIVCLDLPKEELLDIPDYLRRLFRLPQFNTREKRCAKVIQVAPEQIRYYQRANGPIVAVQWPDG